MRSQIVLACTGKKTFYILKTFTSLLLFAGRSSCLYHRMSFRDVMFPGSSCLMLLYCHVATVRNLLTGQSENVISWWLMLKWADVSMRSLVVTLAHLLLSAGTSAPVTRIHQPERGFSEDCSETSSLEEGERSRPVRSALDTHANTITSAHAVLTAAVSSLSFLVYRCGGLQCQSCGTGVNLYF